MKVASLHSFFYREGMPVSVEEAVSGPFLLYDGP
jgi:hypothetical protein